MNVDHRNSNQPLIQDDETMFRLDRRAYTDPAIFEREMETLFEGGWIYLCHESQVPDHGDYYATFAGRQPVFVIRAADGDIRAFVNACAHRGALLTPARRGNARTLVCRFHGWCYDTQGQCVKIKNEATGWDHDRAKQDFALTPLAQFESYKGFIFGSLAPTGQSLAEALGQACPVIDLLAEQSPDGLEVVPGSQSYMIRGNWKLQAENGVDGYHASTVHNVFMRAMATREALGDQGDLRKTEAGRLAGLVPTGCYDLGNGHMASWAGRANPEAAPLAESLDQLNQRFPPERVDWMLRRGRNLYLFPNLHLMDQSSTQIRVMLPRAVDRTETRVYCIAPKGESRSARAARLRKFEDFFMMTGMATPDDLAGLEDMQTGAHGSNARWTRLDRGRSRFHAGADADAERLGLTPVSSQDTWDNETFYYSFYRRWAGAIGNV